MKVQNRGLEPKQVERLIATLQKRLAVTADGFRQSDADTWSAGYYAGANDEASFALQLLEIELGLPHGSLRQ